MASSSLLDDGRRASSASLKWVAASTSSSRSGNWTGQVGMNAPVVLGQRPTDLGRESAGASFADVVEQGAGFEHAIAPGLGLVVEHRLGFEGLLQRRAAAARASLLDTLGGATEQVLAAARSLQQRHVGQLQQCDAQEAGDLDGLALPLYACGHRRTPHLDVGGVGLLLAQGHGVQGPGVHAQFLQRPDLLERFSHRARRVPLGWRLEPIKPGAYAPGLRCIAPVDGLEEGCLADAGLDRGCHGRLGSVEGLARQVCKAARPRDDDAPFVQPHAGGFGEIVGMRGLERGDCQNLLKLVDTNRIQV